MGEALQK